MGESLTNPESNELPREIRCRYCSRDLGKVVLDMVNESRVPPADVETVKVTRHEDGDFVIFRYSDSRGRVREVTVATTPVISEEVLDELERSGRLPVAQ